MRFLIATPLHIFEFETNTGLLKLLRSGDGEYYGMSWNSNLIAISRSGVNNEKLLTWKDYIQNVRGDLYISCNNTRVTTAKHLLAPHQIVFVKNQLVVSNTGLNCLTVFDEYGNLQRNVYLTQDRWDNGPKGRKGKHFNSVYFKKDRLWVVSHNFEKPSEIWELDWPSLQLIRIIRTKASWAHNLWIGDLGMITCNSRYGNLIEVNSGEVIWQADEEPIITRGIAVSNDYIFVGRSEYGNRGNRNRNSGGLWVIDRKTLRTIECYKFPGSGCVNEIRLLDVPDECHGGFIFKNEWITEIKQRKLYNFVQYGIRRMSNPWINAVRLRQQKL